MRKFLITIVSLVLLHGCIKDNTSEKVDKIIENVPVNPMLEKSDFISQSHLHEKKFGNFNFSKENQWNRLNNISRKKIKHKKGRVHPNIRTFGWHVYSNGSSYKNYNFSMLWGISYFSYSVEPKTGNYKNIHQWKTTALIDSAKASNCKVFLSVSNFGSKNNSTFLHNLKAQDTLIKNLSKLLALRSADGINIDFEGVPKKSKANFTNFLIKVSEKLKQYNPNYKISLCLYAEDWNTIFDIKAINPYIDFYTLMGYDYYGSFSKKAGPVTPFNWSEKFGYGLKSSIQYYQKKGVPSKKLIVGLPYYGAEWNTKNSKPGSKVSRFRDHPPYKAIRKIYMDSLNIPVKFDSISASSYLIVKKKNSYRQIFFEDKKSLSIKYDWIKKNKIGGVGIWALGYDDGYSELWDLLAEKFSEEEK